MREMIKKNKGVIRFLGVFLLSYILLTALYRWYLVPETVLDVYTQWVSKDSISLMHFFGEPITHRIENNTVSLIYDNTIIAYIAEGCNAMSIQILFIAFIIAFARKWKPTLLYIFYGVVFIYVMNIVRIALFVMLLHRYPQYNSFLHDIFFPAIIYGSVFLLWMNWVRLFQKDKTNE